MNGDRLSNLTISESIFSKFIEQAEEHLGSRFLTKILSHPIVAHAMWEMLEPNATYSISDQTFALNSDHLLRFCDALLNRKSISSTDLQGYMTLLLKSGLFIKVLNKADQNSSKVKLPNDSVLDLFEQTLQKMMVSTSYAEECVHLIKSYLANYITSRVHSYANFTNRINGAFKKLYKKAVKSNMVTVGNVKTIPAYPPGEAFLCATLMAASSSLNHDNRGVEPWVKLVLPEAHEDNETNSENIWKRAGKNKRQILSPTSEHNWNTGTKQQPSKPTPRFFNQTSGRIDFACVNETTKHAFILEMSIYSPKHHRGEYKDVPTAAKCLLFRKFNQALNYALKFKQWPIELDRITFLAVVYRDGMADSILHTFASQDVPPPLLTDEDAGASSSSKSNIDFRRSSTGTFDFESLRSLTALTLESTNHDLSSTTSSYKSFLPSCVASDAPSEEKSPLREIAEDTEEVLEVKEEDVNELNQMFERLAAVEETKGNLMDFLMEVGVPEPEEAKEIEVEIVEEEQPVSALDALNGFKVLQGYMESHEVDPAMLRMCDEIDDVLAKERMNKLKQNPITNFFRPHN
uniref:Uncharacterized protein n=1 Tax=Ditylenchus dipsaci TaxID=166011 RepID=A0A915E156_9BILA